MRAADAAFARALEHSRADSLTDAVDVAALRPLTRSAGLSLGDRACLALARRLGSPAITADAARVDVDAGVGVELTQIR